MKGIILSAIISIAGFQLLTANYNIAVNQKINNTFSEEMIALFNAKSLNNRNLLASEPELLEPEDGKVYHGACLMTYESGPDPIAPYLQSLNDSTIQPAVRGFFMSIPGERGPANSLKALAKYFYSADSIGFIPELSLFLIGKFATDSVIAVSTEYDWIIDSVITLTENYGKKMFLRIGGEFNGAGEGWNGGGYHPYLYVTMFRKIVDKFNEKGLRDSIAVNWCYEPDAANDFDSVDSRGARWYPGDEYVDWFGLDVFNSDHFDQSLPDGAGRNITKKGKSERFLAMAREKSKPVFLSETSAKGINISADSQDGINDWTNWFAKFWEFINVHKEIKGFNYIDANWPDNAYPGWGDARIENSVYITQKYIEEMKKSKYIHLKKYSKPEITDTIPLIDMSEQTWKGYSGGLYPEGKNEMPRDHKQDGIDIGKNIISLNVNGEADENGKIVFLSIGMSNTTQEYSTFKQLADTFKLKNQKLIIVDGAQGGQTASIIKDSSAQFWQVIEQRLTQLHLTPQQIQVIWLKEANAQPKDVFPTHAEALKNDLKTIVKFLKKKYPNLKLTYLSSRTYGGYATTSLNPEPYAYESGFSVKWLIEEQISGSQELSYKGNRPQVPWLAWGPYLWTCGITPRSDGLVWLREDCTSDGTHPSNSGKMKVANLLLNFFSTDETCSAWFLNSGTDIYEQNEFEDKFIICPNPAVENIILKSKSMIKSDDIKIFNTFGEEVRTNSRTDFKYLTNSNYSTQLAGTNQENSLQIEVTYLPSGIYYVKVENIILKFFIIR